MSEIHEVENDVVNAVGESEDIDESEVIVGEPMTVSEFGQLMQELTEEYGDDE
jgi:hypothetical protein